MGTELEWNGERKHNAEVLTLPINAVSEKSQLHLTRIEEKAYCCSALAL